MSETQSIGLADIMAAAKRRAWIVVLAFILLTPVAVGVAYVLPPVYSATARILVESQQIPDELARSTVTASSAERLELIKQRLLTRQNLISVIEKFNLYADTPGMTLADKIDKLKGAVAFENVAYTAGGRRGDPRGVSAFTVSFRDDRRVLTAEVANEFVTMVLELNLKQRSERATETVAFFQQEAERLAANIQATAKDIITFKAQHADSLPDSLEFRRSQLVSLEKQMFDLEQQRTRLDEERSDIQLKLAQGPAALPEAQLSPEERQIRALENTLTQQQALLSDSHPSIRALKARIAALRASLPSDNGTAQNAGAEDAMAPVRRRLVSLEKQIAALDERSEDLKTDVEELRGSISRTPETEVGLSALNRRMQTLQENQERAGAKLAEASTGAKLEVNRQAERFVVIEQAQVPVRPDAPKRMLIAAAGAGASVAFGVAIAFALELLNSSIRTAADLQRRVNLRPVVVVPYIYTAKEIRRRRWTLITIAAIVLVGIPGILFLIDTYYLPISVLAERYYQRTGLENLFDMIGRRL